jgi:hypothetical protein
MLEQGRYFPSLKTNQSELRALANLRPTALTGVIPVFELTRSRKTTKEPNGSAERRVEQLLEIYQRPNFIFDLTTEDDFLSPEMELLFDETNGYSNWVEFVNRHLPNSAIPALQYEEGGSRDNFVRQAETLLSRFANIALRLPLSDPEASQIVDMLVTSVGLERVVIVATLGFLAQEDISVPLARCERFVQTVLANRVPGKLLFCGSSFPKSVGIPPYGSDATGIFAANEFSIFEQLLRSHRNWNLAHSDYASVHPLRYPTRGGSWVPRVDIPLADELAYERRRRDVGGYFASALEANRKYGTFLPECWGTDQVRLAASGNVPGGSPSFWISVRINIWLTRMQARAS